MKKINKKISLKEKQQAILEFCKKRINNSADLSMAKRKIAKKYNFNVFTNSDILAGYRALLADKKIIPKPKLERLLRKRAIRTMSGIAPVAVLTKPYPCPGKCVYCPNEKDVPQSYLSNEPAVMRAIRCNYHPYIQVQDRLRSLEVNGHEPTKIEIIVIGGTWSYFPTQYKYWYITSIFKATNDYPKKENKIPTNTSLKKLKEILKTEQNKNERAKYKIIGLTLETRPDYINDKELLEMRELGCTRVEIGVQAIDDRILKLNQRGHGVVEIAEATKLLKDYGFKVTYHLMPGLPGATPARDVKMFNQLFNDERFQPDQIKFYPTVVTKGSLLYRWWQQGKYKPYTGKVLENLIIKCKKIVPPYVRIIRLIRDIPSESIEAGNMVTNLRQVMKGRGVECQCIRCREARDNQLLTTNYELLIIKYPASSGKEYFISYESKDKKVLYGFCRLRLPKFFEKPKIKILENSALIRELHVYGELVPVGNKKKIQHAGLGKKLIKEAENIAEKQGYQKIAVISGVGVRGYYRKLGYKLKDSYMVKKL